MIGQATYPEYSLWENQEQALTGNIVSLPCSWCGCESSPLEMLEMSMDDGMVAYVCSPCVDEYKRCFDRGFALLPLRKRLPVYIRTTWVHVRCSGVVRCFSRARRALYSSISRLNERYNPYARIHLLELVLSHYSELFCAENVEETLQELKKLGFHVELALSYVNCNRAAFVAESPEETCQALKDLGYHVEGGK